MSACRGCGDPLPVRVGPGRQREWCSRACQRATLYGGICIDCGAKTRGGSGPNDVSQRCESCQTRHAREAWMTQQQLRRRALAEMWVSGYSIREIAAELGTTANAIGSTMADMRRGGWDLPYRYDWRPGSLGRIAENSRQTRLRENA